VHRVVRTRGRRYAIPASREQAQDCDCRKTAGHLVSRTEKKVFSLMLRPQPSGSQATSK
jgi:hypothetical protein